MVADVVRINHSLRMMPVGGVGEMGEWENGGMVLYERFAGPHHFLGSDIIFTRPPLTS